LQEKELPRGFGPGENIPARRKYIVMKRYYFVFFVAGIFSCKTIDHQNVRPMTEYLTFTNFGIISIDYRVEGCQRSEVNIFYIYGNGIKIHSILRDSESEMDTTFILNEPQVMFIDRFEKAIKENKRLTDDLIYEGTMTTYEIYINQNITKMINKENYSLIKELVQIK
jgi:hypothetical protein